MSENIKKGIIFAFLTATISGFSIFYNKLVVTKGIDPLIFNILKNGGVALILFLILISTKKFPDFKNLSLKQWQKLVTIGAIGGSIPFILYFEGLRTVAATNANLIHKTLFIWVAAIAIPFLGERLNIWQVIGYLLIAWSNLFIGGFAGFKESQGEFMILAATLLWSIENIIAKITLKDLESNLVAWGRMFIGSLILIMVAIIQGKLLLITKIPTTYLLPVAGSIILLTGYVTMWYKALKLAPATIVTSILIISTPITNILTAIFLTHSFLQIQLVNLITTIIGVMFISLFISKYPKKEIAHAKSS